MLATERTRTTRPRSPAPRWPLSLEVGTLIFLRFLVTQLRMLYPSDPRLNSLMCPSRMEPQRALVVVLKLSDSPTKASRTYSLFSRTCPFYSSCPTSPELHRLCE